MRVESKYNVRDHKGRLLIAKGDVYDVSESKGGSLSLEDQGTKVFGSRIFNRNNFIQINERESNKY